MEISKKAAEAELARESLVHCLGLDPGSTWDDIREHFEELWNEKNPTYVHPADWAEAMSELYGRDIFSKPIIRIKRLVPQHS
jgi:hypothetical protein